MADTFKKSETLASDTGLEDAWKDINVDKEQQIENKIHIVTYRGLEQEILFIDSQIASLNNKKGIAEAEMIEVKTAAEAE